MTRNEIIELAADIGLDPKPGYEFACTVSDLETLATRITALVKEDAAQAVERLGMAGYGTLAIAAMLRQGTENE